MTNTMLNSSVLLDEPLKGGSYNFHLPTRATRLDPVFIITFQLDDMELSKNIFNISLNPKLAIELNSTNLSRQYHFDDNGVYQFNNEDFGGYFIEGEIKLSELNAQLIEKSCFLRVTYGKKDEALHYIKGNFQLTELTN